VSSGTKQPPGREALDRAHKGLAKTARVGGGGGGGGGGERRGGGGGGWGGGGENGDWENRYTGKPRAPYGECGDWVRKSKGEGQFTIVAELQGEKVRLSEHKSKKRGIAKEV